MRDEYWLDACDNATIVIEKVTPATVIIELAIEDSIPREPSAPAPNNLGKLVKSLRLSRESNSIATTARAPDPRTMSVGRNHKLERSLINSVLSFTVML